MSLDFEDVLIEEFGSFDTSKFNVSFVPHKIFICGGKTDGKKLIPESLRERIINYFDDNNDDIYKACIKAEDFKDYFREGAYSDLLEFEADIANIATLIIICLESPGSLVELGMFCNNPSLSHRLIVIAPQDKVEAKDSFIYLGPLVNLIGADEKSVLVYPWPDPAVQKYDHIELIAADISKKLEKSRKGEDFDPKNSAHIAFLIYDIILLAHPIKISEIELALSAMDIDVKEKTIGRLLYLLDKIGLIKHTIYSSVNYYYDVADGERRVKFGSTKSGKTRDTPAIKMALRQSYVLQDDESSKKRKLALQQINKIKEDKLKEEKLKEGKAKGEGAK
ncbi:retron St85 family effector protein [Pseudomonas aeruginosa]|nr:retron St85 family effector protein [Pseudomonas aeruginosa]